MHSTRRIRAAQPLLMLLAGAAATIAVLVMAKPAITGPTPVGSPVSWTGDDLAVMGMWCGALIGSTWLAVTTLACIAALARGRARTARRIARFAPPLARRMLQTALIGTWALGPGTANATAPSAPVTVQVDANGRLSTDAIGRSTTTTTTGATPVTAAPVPPVRVAPRIPTSSHVVVRGDNLWQIARTALTATSSASQPTEEQPTEREVARYWWRVIAANRTTLSSGDPNLIFPGEVVTLP